MIGPPQKLIVAFGAAVWPGEKASPTLAGRAAAAAAQAEPAAGLFLSGGIGDFAPSEAQMMARLLSNAVDRKRLILDERSRDTLQTVRAAVTYARKVGCCEITICTDAYHQLRVALLFHLFGLSSCRIPLAPRGSRRLRARMWLRECAALPYDLVAGLAAVRNDRRRRVTN